MSNRILVVDDDVSLRRVMRLQLEEAGYQVSVASDGEEAWSMLRESEPQLVITDLRMPTTGLELLSRITQAGLRTTVIVVTAFGTVETAVEAFGPKRCMLESNTPVDRGSYACATGWNAFKRLTASLPDEDRSALFCDTARDIYRLEKLADAHALHDRS